MLLNQVYELLVLHSTRANDNNVLSEVVPPVEVNDHLSVDLSDVVDVSEDWLAHHVLSVDVEVDILHEGLLGVLVDCLQLLPDCILLVLNMVVVVHTIAEHVSHDLHGLGDTAWERQGVVESMLS